MLLEFAISAGLATKAFFDISEAVSEPYIDEIFHFPQTVRYCNGDFTYWDDKITTPPGLYILGYMYQKLLGYFPSIVDSCSLDVLRSLNFIGVVVVIPLILYKLLHVDVTVAAMPLIAFYSNLYYTDVWSTVFVLLSAGLATQDNAVAAALASAVSIWFRQTNIIWAGYIAVTMLDSGSITDTIKAAFRKTSVTVSFGAVAAAFAGFLKYNGGITLGDKSNHQVAINIPQLFYFSLFYLFLSWPLWLSVSEMKKYPAVATKNARSFIAVVIALASCCYVIENFTIVHPFILADNRHYTFYLWRRLIFPSWSPYAKFMLAPVYFFGTWQFMVSVNMSFKSLISSGAFCGAILLTLVPSPLLEPRYYIIPYMLLRITQNPSPVRAKLEWVWYMAINTITIWIFINKPFIGPDGVVSRFMW